LKGYLRTVDAADFVPQTDEELHVLLNAYLLEKTVSELQEELRHRPEGIQIQLARVQMLLCAGA
jgi:maltose alpha-D-glucosyltransferase/alpha-amylase